MAEFLVFTLAAPIASFGVGAGNFSRGSLTGPGHSLIVGLLGAALGLERDDARLSTLSKGLRVATAMEARGAPLRDFHTIQSPKEKRGEPPRTRRHALLAPKDKLYTTISERDYFCDVLATIAVARADGPFSLEMLKQALITPRFTLYLGRKSCPLALPPAPDLVEAETADEAMRAYRDCMSGFEELFPARPRAALVQADARLYPAQTSGRRSRRRTEPAQRSAWSYRLLEELTLGATEGGS